MDLNTNQYSAKELVELFLNGKKKNTLDSYRRAILLWAGYLRAGIIMKETAANLAALGELSLSRLLEGGSAFNIVDFKNRLAADGLQWSTIGSYFAILSSFYEFLRAGGLHTSSKFTHPAVKIKRADRLPKEPTLALTDEEVQLMLSMPNRDTIDGKRDCAILCLMFGAGLRRSAIAKLKREDINRHSTRRLEIVLRDGKTQQYERRSLSAWVADALEAHLMASGDGYYSTPIFNISSITIYRMFKRYLRQAGITMRYSPHSARSTGVSKLLELGFSHKQVQKFTGHTSVRQVEEYDRRRLEGRDDPGQYLSYGGGRPSRGAPDYFMTEGEPLGTMWTAEPGEHGLTLRGEVAERRLGRLQNTLAGTRVTTERRVLAIHRRGMLERIEFDCRMLIRALEIEFRVRRSRMTPVRLNEIKVILVTIYLCSSSVEDMASARALINRIFPELDAVSLLNVPVSGSDSQDS